MSTKLNDSQQSVISPQFININLASLPAVLGTTSYNNYVSNLSQLLFQQVHSLFRGESVQLVCLYLSCR